MIGKSWRILRGKLFPPENANFWTWVYKQLHWTSNRLVFVNAAGIDRKAAWLGYAINIVSVECGYLALYTNWVFVSVEFCWLYTKLGQLGKSSAGASVKFFETEGVFLIVMIRALVSFLWSTFLSLCCLLFCCPSWCRRAKSEFLRRVRDVKDFSGCALDSVENTIYPTSQGSEGHNQFAVLFLSSSFVMTT